MAKQTRDQKLAAKLRAKQGDSYQSASERSQAAARTNVTPGASATQIYDQIRDTPASKERRRSSKSSESVSRWRRSVNPKWNG